MSASPNTPALSAGPPENPPVQVKLASEGVTAAPATSSSASAEERPRRSRC